MNQSELIQAAQQVIGTGRSRDYEISPTAHANELANAAPALAAVLRKSAISVIAEEYERNDRQANQNQSVFKTMANRANWAILLTACFSALLLLTAPLQVSGASRTALVVIFGVCGVISGGLGAMWLALVRGRKLLENWMSARASAEALRAKYFEAVTSFEPQAADNSPIPLPLLQLEYFRRYQFDVQMAFYDRRAVDHRRNADRMANLAAGAVALASISAGLATVLSGFDPRWVSIAALGAIATALASFAATKTEVSQSRRNAELYTNARNALALLKGKLDDVRAAAADGEPEPLKQFVAAVHQQISAEHAQWLAAAQNIQPSIDKLNETLENLKAKKSEPPPPPQAAPSTGGK